MGDLDYTIVFPEPGLQGSLWGEHREPVVILLGWGGCKDQHLAKYSNIYHSQGCIVIRYTASWSTVFITESFGLSNLRQEAKKLLELLFDYEIEKCPLLFHVFSNGGFMLYRYIVELLHSHRQLSKLRVVGTVFDSSPGNRNVRGSVRALNAILKPTTNTVLRILALAAFTLLVVVLRIILYPVTRLFHENHYDALINDVSPWPQLYLYSRGDPIISYLDVEHMISVRRKQHLPVKSCDFDTSAHVCHYRQYSQRYTDLCTSFLKNCIRESSALISSSRPSL
ncbi:transmembrane protein 53 [Pelodytes ibericus]